MGIYGQMIRYGQVQGCGDERGEESGACLETRKNGEKSRGKEG